MCRLQERTSMAFMVFKLKECERCWEKFPPNSGSARFCSPMCHLMMDATRQPNGCLKSRFAGDRRGYPQIVLSDSGRKNRRAHRVSYELHKGKIPKGKCVCHTCDHPWCIEPDHLFDGTCADNSADCVSKGRQLKGTEIGIAKLTEAQVLDIYFGRETGVAMAAKYQVGESAISSIRKGDTWGWLTGAERAA